MRTDLLSHTGQLNSGEFSDPAIEKGGVVAEVFLRSVAMNKPLKYMTYLYIQHANCVLTNDALYTDLKS